MDNLFKKHGFLICSLFSIVLGALIFLWIFGYEVLNPNNIDWIQCSTFDIRLYQIGWHYFAHSPWSFPLGTFDSLSNSVATSVYNTDSIPLFAIFFKLFKGILPDDFQYFGIYALLCFILQSFLGMLIIRKFTKDDLLGNITAVLSGVIFCLMPAVSFFAFWHTGIASHFIILSCFIPVIYKEKFNLKSNIIYFGLTGFLAGSINIYILAISGIICFVYCLYLCFVKKNIKQFLPFVSYVLSAFFVLYIIGAFIGISKYKSEGLYELGFNLNSFINSYGYMRLQGLESVNETQIRESYAYFGLGILALIVITIIKIITNFSKSYTSFLKYKKEIIFIIALIAFSFILAISPRATFSDMVLFEVPYPDFIVNIWSIFRMTGRFIWIASYIFLILSLIYVIKIFSKKICLTILICCIGLQIWDFTKFIENETLFLKEKIIGFEHKYINDSLKKLFEKNNIKYIYFDNFIFDNIEMLNVKEEMLDIAEWVRNKKIKLNAFCFARPLKHIDKIYFEELKNPKNEDIFIFPKNQFNEKIIKSGAIKHYYSYNHLIIASPIGLKGLEEREISKNKLLNGFKGGLQ